MATTSARRGDGEAAAAVQAPHAAPRPGLFGLAATAARSARDLVGHTVEIAALESRLAGTALAAMAAIGVGVVVLVLSAWGLGLAAAARGLMAAGLGPAVSLLLLAAINVVVAAVLILVMMRLARRLKFAATRRVLERLAASRSES